MSAPPVAPRLPATAPSRPVVSNWVLFTGPCLIWGSTWLVIKYQLGIVAPEVSVAYRFFAAALVLFAWCAARREQIRFALRDHFGLFMLGSMHFALNYVFVYLSEEYLTSGLVAVVFALMVFWNLLGAHWLFGLVLTRRLVIGAACGLLGVALVFWPELLSLSGDRASLKGLVLAVVATVSASAANLYSQRVYGRGWPVLPTTAWSMFYGALGVAAYCAVARLPFTWDSSVAYQASFAYLALIGSVVAFAMYLTLLKRIGAGRAGYTSAVIPVIAMLISTAFEDYVWTLPALVGMALVLVGNVLVLRR
jgi:drug/metabolite transporter (DMT)-like permease